MSSPTFYDFEKRIFELYNNKKFHEALDVAVLARQKFPDRPQRTYFWILCLYSLIGESDKAIATLENALDMGVWWSEQMLKSEPDLKSLQERSDFRDILQRCEKMKVEVQTKNNVELLLFTPPNSKHPLPLS